MYHQKKYATFGAAQNLRFYFLQRPDYVKHKDAAFTQLSKAADISKIPSGLT